LLQLIAGLAEPTSGRLLIDGRDATWLHASKRGIGMVFQNYALFPHLSVRENVAFPLRMRRLPEADIARKVSEALEMVRLPQVGDRLPKELSGGQQQRIALARCLVYDPAIILMDEPLGALDKKLREHMQIEIKRIHRRTGTTILYVTHDQEEALSMSDRICLMRDGAIEQYGTPQELYYEPKSGYVADFLGQPNVLAGEVVDKQGGIATFKVGTLVLKAHDSRSSPGAKAARLLIRPEKLGFWREGQPVENIVEAEIIDVSMIGPLTKFTATTEEGIELLSVSLSERDSRGITCGDTVRLNWKPEDARIVEDGR
jgi:putative spermidine/putrescine transport system ATP-binding protein